MKETERKTYKKPCLEIIYLQHDLVIVTSCSTDIPCLEDVSKIL